MKKNLTLLTLLLSAGFAYCTITPGIKEAVKNYRHPGSSLQDQRACVEDLIEYAPLMQNADIKLVRKRIFNEKISADTKYQLPHDSQILENDLNDLKVHLNNLILINKFKSHCTARNFIKINAYATIILLLMAKRV